VQFRVLGPLEVLDGGTALALGGPRQRLVLAYLILEANRVVSTDRLIDRIWGDEPPDAARAALFAYISRLRKLLGAARIQARPPGYVFVGERDDIDSLRFADLVDEARRGADNREMAVARLTEALQLWRGGALSDLADSQTLQPEIARLEATRLGALEDRAEAEVDLGRFREAIPQLEALTTEFPFRERLWSQLILALYRSGRQGDALNAYHRARITLVEELGIDPSTELRRLHEQVLQQDPALDFPTAQPGHAPPAAVPAAAFRSGTVVTAAQNPPRWRRYLLVAAAIGLLAIAAFAWLGRGPATLPPTVWTIGLDMPLSGPAADVGQPVRNAVQMAVDDFNATGGLDGSTLAVHALDDAGNPARGAENAHALVNDPATIAMIGGWGSEVTYALIPITNEAGLLECSPASTLPELTKPRDGALDVRAAHPDAINFVRLAPADDIQAVALASFAYRDLGARYALVIDDADVGRIIADPFEEEFKRLGGTTLRRALNPGDDPRALLAPLDDNAAAPGLVFFGGATDTGAVAVRRAMATTGHASTPFLSWDPLLDGSGSQAGSFIQQVGLPGAIGSYVAHASLPDHKSSFADAYRARFGSDPDEYSAAGYACVEIIIAAMRGIAASGPTADKVRQLIRAYAVAPAHRYETILGTVGFDANGDALQQFVTFYRVEASAGNGSGDWVTFKKQDFGPAP
jgi:ABC-type branched-subunit amino acid transport system substrate-binding protein/DNA-binding SARP family transcriptional activator